jgi:hypothetical protein
MIDENQMYGMLDENPPMDGDCGCSGGTTDCGCHDEQTKMKKVDSIIYKSFALLVLVTLTLVLVSVSFNAIRKMKN